MTNEKETEKITVLNFPIGILESILKYGIESRRLRRLWFICFLLSIGTVIALTVMFLAQTFRPDTLLAFLSLAGGTTGAFLIAWINEVAREKERHKRRAKFRAYYHAKFTTAKNKIHKSAICKEIDERNLFEDRPIFTEQEIIDITK